MSVCKIERECLFKRKGEQKRRELTERERQEKLLIE